jgi:hypothetical protein
MCVCVCVWERRGGRVPPQFVSPVCFRTTKRRIPRPGSPTRSHWATWSLQVDDGPRTDCPMARMGCGAGRVTAGPGGRRRAHAPRTPPPLLATPRVATPPERAAADLPLCTGSMARMRTWWCGSTRWARTTTAKRPTRTISSPSAAARTSSSTTTRHSAKSSRAWSSSTRESAHTFAVCTERERESVCVCE